MTNPEIAATMFVSRKTVEANLAKVYRKLGVRSRVELARRLPPPAPSSSPSGVGPVAVGAGDPAADAG